MIIKNIKLVNFRNHSSYILECDDETSLILGKNGSGKTSVLEAIFISTRGKSFRATDKEILKRGKDFYRIELEYKNGEKIITTFDGENKFFNLSNKKHRRLPKNSKYPIILFLPSDLNLINNSPSARRNYFNNLFSEFNENYYNYLLKYEKALKQRNELLKKPNLKQSDLFSWDIILAKYGTKIYQLRQKYTDEINQVFTKTYRTISKNKDEVEIIYKTEIKDENTYLKNLQNDFNKDICLSHTNFGIHRDDFIFNFNHKLANGSASRGETRSVILALKFIEADLIYQKQNQKPIILLDDVFSELDETRRKCLIKNFKENQVIITSVEKVD